MAKKTGIELIAAERARQIDVKGFKAPRDAQYTQGQLLLGAIAYIQATGMQLRFGELPKCFVPMAWPWDRSTWRPGDRKRNLAKAGAMIAAEIDRIENEELAARIAAVPSNHEAREM